VLFIAVLCGFALSSMGERASRYWMCWSRPRPWCSDLRLPDALRPGRRLRRPGVHRGPVRHHLAGALAKLVGTLYIACAFFVLVVLGGICRAHGFSLWKLLRYLREEFLVVLGTSSTEPVLPRMLEKLEALGCKKGVVGWCCPLATRSTSTARPSTCRWPRCSSPRPATST
jgi:hypothetical protein